MHDDETFLGRWSRRKAQGRGQAQPVEPRGETHAPPTPSAPLSESVPHGADDRMREAPTQQPTGSARDQRGAADTALPPVDSLRGLESEYADFMKPEVSPQTQRAALKKLFADPHFNQMDGLDVYIDDYGKFEPMPAAVATSLAAFHRLSVFDHLASEQPERQEVAAGAADAGAARSTDAGGHDADSRGHEADANSRDANAVGRDAVAQSTTGAADAHDALGAADSDAPGNGAA